MPFGFLLPFLTGRPKSIGMIAVFGFLLSLAIEFSQYMFGTGYSELDDLLLNTVGTLIGFLIYRAYAHKRMKTDKRETESADAAEI